MREGDFERVSPTRACVWLSELDFPAALVWLKRKAHTEASQEQRARDRDADVCALEIALGECVGPLPHFSAEDLGLRRDPLGKPLVEWHGALKVWAERSGLSDRNLHISNSHDGTAHLLFTAYHPELVGVGVDVVSMARLRKPGKGEAYLRRFARQFMSEEERAAFEAEPVTSEENLRIRVAAHFSLMESASKACGTGLRLGAGMGHAYSLSPRELGALSVSFPVRLWFGPSALARLEEIGASRAEGFWGADGEHLISLVLLWRE